VQLLDATDHHLVATLEGHMGPIRSLVFSPDGMQLASGADDKTVRVWRALDGALLATLHLENDALRVVYSPSGRRLAVASDAPRLHIWSASTFEELGTLTHDGGVYDVTFDKADHWIATAPTDRLVRVWDAHELKEVARLPHAGLVWTARFDRDGTHIVTAGEDGAARIWGAPDGWDHALGENGNPLEGREKTTAATFSDDGTMIAVSSRDQTVTIYDARSRHAVALLRHAASVVDVRFSIDGSYLVSEISDGTVAIWKLSPTHQSPIEVREFARSHGGVVLRDGFPILVSP
jgi:uncharacterized protein with WD repeat